MICKLLERLMKDHLVEFLVNNSLINPSQCGFLKARSCLSNIFSFLEDVTKWVHLEYFIQTWRSYRKKDFDILERTQRRTTKMIQQLRNISNEMRLKECGLTKIETRRLRRSNRSV